MENQNSFSPNDVLGVRADATAEEIKAKWREKVKVLHPDAGGDPVLFDITLKAYESALKNLENKEKQSNQTSQDNPKAQSSQHRGPTFPYDNVRTPKYGSANAGKASGKQEETKVESSGKKKRRYPAEMREISIKEIVITFFIFCGLVAGSIFARFSGLNRSLLGISLTQKMAGGHNLVDSSLPSIKIFPGGYLGVIKYSIILGLCFGALWLNRARRAHFPLIEKIVLGFVFFSLIFWGEYILIGIRLWVILILLKLYHSWFVRSKLKSKKNKKNVPERATNENV